MYSSRRMSRLLTSITQGFFWSDYQASEGPFFNKNSLYCMCEARTFDQIRPTPGFGSLQVVEHPLSTAQQLSSVPVGCGCAGCAGCASSRPRGPHLWRGHHAARLGWERVSTARPPRSFVASDGERSPEVWTKKTRPRF